MVIDDICWKLYFWPFLSHLANIKGICPNIKPVWNFPIITLPPGTVLGTTSTTTRATTTTTRTTPTSPTTATIPTFQPTFPTIPTFQPTVPTVAPTLPTIPTFQPTFPTIPTYQPIPSTVTAAPTTPSTVFTFQPTLPTVPTVPTFQPYLPCPQFPLVCTPGGVSPIVYCPCIDPRNSPSVAGRDTLIFQSLAQNCISAGTTEGHCTRMAACPHFLEEFYSKSQMYSQANAYSNFVGESICGFDGVNFLICCPARYVQAQQAVWNSDPFVNAFHFGPLNSVQMASTTTTAPPTTAMAMNTDQCGLSPTSTTRVVGGFEAKKGAYPWIAALGYNSPVQFLCAGSLITRQHVLTAAHCISPSLRLARLGAHFIYQTEAEAIDVSVSRTIVHEEFDPKSTQNDIAMVLLSQPITVTSRVRPICLPVDSKFSSQDFFGSNPFVAGWGAVHFQGPSSPYLQDAQVPIVSTQQCMESYKNVYQGIEFNEKLICAGTGITDACQGDSGGPLMMPEISSDGKTVHYYIIGIVSFGYECARPGFPGVYVRVSSYVPWIQSKLRSASP